MELYRTIQDPTSISGPSSVSTKWSDPRLTFQAQQAFQTWLFNDLQ